MDFSNLLCGFVKVATWICQSLLTKISKLIEASALNQKKVVEQVKVLNALGPLCLWPCLFVSEHDLLRSLTAAHSE